MKKPGKKKRPLRSRKGRRARHRANEERQRKAAERRLAKIEEGWTPKHVVPERPDPKKVAEAKRKERKERRQEEAAKQATITARLKEWMAKGAGKEVEDE